LTILSPLNRVKVEVCMKKLLILTIVLVLASAAFAQNLEWFKGSLDEAYAKAKADHKLVLLDFNSYT
jgi:hypothetical protein